MIHTRIAELISELATKDLSEDELCEFLVTNTLTFMGVKSAWIAEITSRKTVRSRASFGVDQSKFPDWQEFPLDLKLPVTDALREQRFLWINTLPSWPTEYPSLHGVQLGADSKTMIIIPVLRVGNSNGCIGFISNQVLNPDMEIELMLRTITSLVSLHVTQRKSRIRKPVESANVTSLTDRQLHILSLIAQKLTNVEIADQMGYSESTIRQETMRIFSKLNVEGRNEARAYFEANKRKFGLVANEKIFVNLTSDVPQTRGSQK